MEGVAYAVMPALRGLQVKAHGLESRRRTAGVAEDQRASGSCKSLDLVIGLELLPHRRGKRGVRKVGREAQP
jgi:hypothetical protein